jgi:hypothetical protein
MSYPYGQTSRNGEIGQEPDDHARRFYGNVVAILRKKDVSFMVGGSYAASFYTSRPPHTKDLDIFLPPSQVESALTALACAGFDTEQPYPFWIAKAHDGHDFVDLISRAASGLWEVEDDWLENAAETTLWDTPVRMCAVEELIWTKAALMDRNRYDGNDVLHLLQAKAHELDWERLRQLAGPHWRLLLAHLTLFGYVYPDLVPLVPRHLLAELSLRLLSERPETISDDNEPLCRGTLISNSQYLLDVENLGYQDARLRPWGRLEPDELAPWVDAVKRGDT